MNSVIYVLRHKQNEWHFADNFSCVSSFWHFSIAIQIWRILVPEDQIYNQQQTTWHWTSLCLSQLLPTSPLKWKCHFDEIFVTGCTESCHIDNFRCSQWRKFRQNDSFVSVTDTQTHISECFEYWPQYANNMENHYYIKHPWHGLKLYNGSFVVDKVVYFYTRWSIGLMIITSLILW